MYQQVFSRFSFGRSVIRSGQVIWRRSTMHFYWQAARWSSSLARFNSIRSYLQRWKTSFGDGRTPMKDESAWITFEALDYLDRWIRPTHSVFEYGSGGSTLYFCRRAARVVSVEHDKDWYATVEEHVRLRGFKHWQGHLVVPQELKGAGPRSPESPNDFASTLQGFENYSFEDYARTIARYEFESFDVIMVDGRARPSCIQQALPYLRSGGLLVLDNADRPYYTVRMKDVLDAQFKPVLCRYSPIPYVPYFVITMILEKR